MYVPGHLSCSYENERRVGLKVDEPEGANNESRTLVVLD